MYMPTRVLVVCQIKGQPVCGFFLFQPGTNQPVCWDCLGVSQPMCGVYQVTARRRAGIRSIGLQSRLCTVVLGADPVWKLGLG